MGKDPVTGDKVAGWQRALNALPYIKQLKKVTPLLKVSDNITVAPPPKGVITFWHIF